MTDAGLLPICFSKKGIRALNERGHRPLSFHVEKERGSSIIQACYSYALPLN